jgi:hypothetical protein
MTYKQISKEDWYCISKMLRGVDLVAYGMTELLPSSEGDFNVKFMRIILENAGSNYLMAIPAMSDMYLSFGLYQFTSYALRDDAERKAGVSKVNYFLPERYRIPGSVIKLRNGENHRAAYLFAVHNILMLVRNLNDKQLRNLDKVYKQKGGDIVTYVATSHHAPKLAQTAMISWLSDRVYVKKVTKKVAGKKTTVKEKRVEKGGSGHINPHLKDRLVKYGEKTDKNLEALEKILR